MVEAEAHRVRLGVRDHLGLWNNGASLLSLSTVSGLGQGDWQHLERWKETYE
ncbi:hypothetical protein [Streptomyces harbinensis]|uniref:hypothetical protein n=1 Tax=Streptomyces harbinensis TaxID=1176198 RepID=UPI0034DDE678